MARKNELWRLKYDRVLYFDADTFVLPDESGRAGARSSRLQALWSAFPLRKAGTVAATGIRPRHYVNNTLADTCFNGGMLMLRPDARSAALLDGIDASRARREPDPATGRVCPGFDQPLLNRAFGQGAWQRIQAEQWRSITHWIASPDHPAVCRLSERDALLASADAYHFFHKVNPWENVYCTICVHAGMRCRPVVPVGHECPVQALAQSLWWQTLLGALPPNATRECLALTEQVAPDTVGAPTARRAKLQSRMCTGCSTKPTLACTAATGRKRLQERR